MPKKPKGPDNKKSVETLTHDEASRKNIPTAEYESVMRQEDRRPVKVSYPRGSAGLETEKEQRNRDLDPQLVWRGKDQQDWSDLVVPAPPLYIQEKIHPKVLVDDLVRRTAAGAPANEQYGLFADFNGLPSEDARTEFYQHDANWTNRMILGDSLQVMASLAEREGLRGKVQCIYFDPPFGIEFNSNFQWSTTSRDSKDGDPKAITREPEQTKAFRDTWRDGIHSYLGYLRDRLTVMRDLLCDSGSIFVQMSETNVHRVRALMDEVFRSENCISSLTIQKTGSTTGDFIQPNTNTVLWYAKNRDSAKGKFRKLHLEREGKPSREVRNQSSLDRLDFGANPLTSDGFRETTTVPFEFQGRVYHPGANRHWGLIPDELKRLGKAGRLVPQDKMIRFKFFWDDYPVTALSAYWDDVGGATDKVYVVQTTPIVIQRLILMTTDPGDLVLDPTCGSGTTAYVSELWGRRWITIDTSRVALALARARIMGKPYPYFTLTDSQEGAAKRAEIFGVAPSSGPWARDVRQGFEYERVPHVTPGSIGTNTSIDVIWEKFQAQLEPLRARLNEAAKAKYEEWQIPRDADSSWPAPAQKAHTEWWRLRIARQKEIDASIAAKADFEYLYDKPYEDKKKVRVAGPFTVESLSPHRVLTVGADDELIDPLEQVKEAQDFAGMVLENLKSHGLQQAHKEDRIDLSPLTPWPGHYIAAEGRYHEGDKTRRAAIFIGPEFGTVSRQDLVAAAREAGDAAFDVLIACAFNYDAHSEEFNKLGRIPVLKARMNADLHMAADLKNTGKGNLFVIFGEPDIVIEPATSGQVRVKVRGIDVFHPATGEVRSDGPDGIACWFVDTDYNEESFFVRHAYFLGANDPYKALKTSLKAEIDEEAWASLRSDTSRPFDKPRSGRIAVKVINHLGDEVMKVFRVE